jgi:hypothetical protein
LLRATVHQGHATGTWAADHTGRQATTELLVAEVAANLLPDLVDFIRQYVLWVKFMDTCLQASKFPTACRGSR